MRKKIQKIVLILMILIISPNLQSQIRQNRNLSSDKYNSDFIYMQSESKDSVDCYFIFSINRESLSFPQSKGAELNGFVALPQLEITVTDSIGIIKKRIFWKDTLTKSDKFSDKYENRVIEARLPKSKLSIALQFSDKNGSFAWRDAYTDVQLNNIQNNSPLFYFKDNNKLNFCSMGGKAPFGDMKYSALILLNTNSEKDYKIKISRIKNEDMYFNWNFVKDELLNVKSKMIGGFNISSKSSEFSFNSRTNVYGVEIEMPNDKLAPGAYTISVIDGKDTIKKANFYSYWQNMPKYLTRLDQAIKISSVVFTDKELEPVLDAKNSEKYKKFLDLWNTKYSLSSNYNSAMNEFFRRADIAENEMQTIDEKEGAKTDRGKIYLLNGKADIVDRKTLADKTTEKWTYKKLKKEYYFETISNGVYRLKKISDIK